MVKAGAKGVTDTSKGALKMSEDTIKGTAEAATKSAKKIGEGLKKVIPIKKKKEQNPEAE